MPDRRRDDVSSIADAIVSATESVRRTTRAAGEVGQPATAAQLEVEIRSRISKAADLESLHRPSRPGWCVCHRQWPCSVVLTAREIREDAGAELRSLLELPDTIVLPVIRPEVDQPPNRRFPYRLPRLRVFGTRRRRERRWLRFRQRRVTTGAD